MATKNLSRTVIEGGRVSGNKWDRRDSNKKHRGHNRNFANTARSLVDVEEAPVFPERDRVRKDFSDKLGPIYRWLRSQVGKKWDAIFSELTSKFDTRTVAGRHVIFDHLLRDITFKLSDWAHFDKRTYGESFYIAEDRTLQLNEVNRWNRKSLWRTTSKERVTRAELQKWADNRMVRYYSPTSIFWMVPHSLALTACGTYSARHGKWFDGHRHECPRHHELVVERQLVYSADSLSADAKKHLHKEVQLSGREVYYRHVLVRKCLQPSYNTTFRQQGRFSEQDAEMWNKLTRGQRESLIYVSAAEKEAKHRKEQARERETRRKEEAKLRKLQGGKIP